MSKVTQVQLQTLNSEPTLQMMTWLDADARIKEKAIITLKGDKENTEWVIMHVYGTEDKHSINNRGWDNNNYDKHDGTPLKERIKR